MTARKERKRIYVGYYTFGSAEIFRSATEPTHTTHRRYAAVVGPFRTMRGATFMQEHGNSNPHCRTVADAERLGKASRHLT